MLTTAVRRYLENANAESAYIIEVEMKIEKDNAIELFRNVAGEDVQNELQAMWFMMSTTTYRNVNGKNSGLSGVSRYLTTDIRNITDDQKSELLNYGRKANHLAEYAPALIVFAPEGAEITSPVNK